MQRPWVEAKGTLAKVPMPLHPPVLVIAVRDEWWEDWESGTYPIHSGMSRIFYLPQHRTLSTRHPLALRRMRSTGCWVSANERRYWKYLGSPPRVWTTAFREAGRHSTTRLLSCVRICTVLYILYILDVHLRRCISKMYGCYAHSPYAAVTKTKGSL